MHAYLGRSDQRKALVENLKGTFIEKLRKTPVFHQRIIIEYLLFDLSREVMLRLRKWRASKGLSDNDSDYIFTFIPAGMGVIQEVRNISTGGSIDLTEYDNW